MQAPILLITAGRAHITAGAGEGAARTALAVAVAAGITHWFRRGQDSRMRPLALSGLRLGRGPGAVGAWRRLEPVSVVP